MALSRDEYERIQRLQRQLDARSRLETERALFRLLKRYDRLVDELQPLREEVLRRLEAGDLDGSEAAIEQMQELAARQLRAIERAELADIRAMLERASLRGAQVVDLAPAVAAMASAGLSEILAALEQAAAAGDGEGGRLIGVGYGRITREAVEAIERKVYRDGLNLSRRLHTRLEERRREFERLLVDGLTEGRGAIQLARQIERLDITDPQLPRYLRDLERTLKGTREAGLADEIRRAAAEAAKRKRGPLGIGGVSRRVVQAARSGSAERLDRAIEEFLQRKVRYHAIVIARTEANAVFREAHVRKAQETPWVRGVAWRLSRSHAREDVCDTLATQDRHGLGPGLSARPGPRHPHPQDMCYRTDVVDLDWFTAGRREQARRELEGAVAGSQLRRGGGGGTGGRGIPPTGGGGEPPAHRIVRGWAAGRPATDEEIEVVRAHVAAAGFHRGGELERLGGRGAGVVWEGRVLRGSDRLPADVVHYVRHILGRQDWPEGTTFEEYIRSGRETIEDPASGIFVSRYKGLQQVGFIRPSGRWRGRSGKPWIVVDYRLSMNGWMTIHQIDMDRLIKEPLRSDLRWIRDPE